MLIEGFSLDIFLKAILRIFPTLFLLKTPEKISLSFYIKIFLTLILSLSLYARLLNENIAGGSFRLDAFLGLAVGMVVSLFFSAASNFSYFFAKGFESSENNSWKNLLDAFAFIILILFLAHLKIERSVLNILASVPGDLSINSKLTSLDFWSQFMKDFGLLGLKISSFGFVFVLTKKFFDEVYVRIGGDEMRIVFSLSFFLLFLILSPLLIPAFGQFVTEALSSFWKSWMGRF